MHELSIAMSIVELAQEEAERHGAAKVEAVHLRLGQLSGVVKEALLFSYEMACQSTILEGSRLLIEEISVEALCPQCNAPRQISSLQCFQCLECGAPTQTILRGKELEVVALEMAE